MGKAKSKKASDLITLAHVDDHEMFRTGLARLLEDEPGLKLVHSSDGSSLEMFLAPGACDVLLMDLSLPGREGLEWIKILHRKYPRTSIIVLSMHKDPQYIRAAVERGACGYLLKDDVFETVVAAVQTVARGGEYYSRTVQEELRLEAIAQAQAADSLELLSEREIQVLMAVARGRMNKEIAEELFLSVRTVEGHRARIMQKLRIPNIQGLVHFALRHRLI